MIMLTPCQYSNLKNEIEILKQEKMRANNSTPQTDVAQNAVIQNSVPTFTSSDPTLTPASTPAPAPAPVPSVSDSDSSDFRNQNNPSIDQVVELLPKNIRNKGKLLLTHIEQSACLTWDSLLHVIISGKVLHRSNLADLMKYVLQTGRSPSFIPNHLIDFLCCLKKANVPQTILNANARKKIQTIKNADSSSESRSINQNQSVAGGGVADLNVDAFSFPPPGLKSLQNKNKRKKSFVWMDY